MRGGSTTCDLARLPPSPGYGAASRNQRLDFMTVLPGVVALPDGLQPPSQRYGAPGPRPPAAVPAAGADDTIIFTN